MTLEPSVGRSNFVIVRVSLLCLLCLSSASCALTPSEGPHSPLLLLPLSLSLGLSVSIPLNRLSVFYTCYHCL